MRSEAGPAVDKWLRLEAFALDTYGVIGEPVFEGHAWSLRFRRGGKTLFTLMSNEAGFRALVVVGPSAWELASAARLSAYTREKWETARPYADGRWIWLTVTDDAVVADIETLVRLKSPPPRRTSRT